MNEILPGNVWVDSNGDIRPTADIRNDDIPEVSTQEVATRSVDPKRQTFVEARLARLAWLVENGMSTDKVSSKPLGCDDPNVLPPVYAIKSGRIR